MGDLSQVWQETESLVEDLKYSLQLAFITSDPASEMKATADMRNVLQRIQANCAKARALSEAQERSFSNLTASTSQVAQQQALQAQQQRISIQAAQAHSRQQPQAHVRPSTIMPQVQVAVRPAGGAHIVSLAPAYYQAAVQHASAAMFNPMLNPYGAVLQQPAVVLHTNAIPPHPLPVGGAPPAVAVAAAPGMAAGTSAAAAAAAAAAAQAQAHAQVAQAQAAALQAVRAAAAAPGAVAAAPAAAAAAMNYPLVKQQQ